MTGTDRVRETPPSANPFQAYCSFHWVPTEFLDPKRDDTRVPV